MSIFTLVKKDFKIVISDKKALLILIAMPIILFSILSVALAGSFSDSDDEVWKIEVGIVKLYNLEEDIKIVNELIMQSNTDETALDSIMELEQILFKVLDSDELDFISYEIMSMEEAQKRIDSNELSSVVILPENYVSDLFINMSPSLRRKVDIKIIKSSENQYSSDIAENIITEITNKISQMMILNKVTVETLNYYNLDKEIISLYQKEASNGFDGNEQIKIHIEDYKIDKLKMVNSGQYYSVAMMAMFLLFGASYGAKFLLLEKKNFTLQRQQMAGLSSVTIVGGKLVIIFLIALMQIIIMIATSYFVFKVYWGNPISVLLLTLLVSFGITGFGSLIAAISLKIDSLKAINVLESGLFQLIALFGGSYFPIYLMPAWFQKLSKFILNGAALDAYTKIMMESPFTDIVPSLISITLNGVGFMIIGLLIISKQPQNDIISSNKKEVTI